MPGIAGLLLAGCTMSPNVQPVPTAASQFGGWNCAELQDEFDHVQEQALATARRLDQRVGTNAAVMIGGVVFWPVLLALQPGTADGDELARLKGRDDALRAAMHKQSCPAPEEMPAAQRSALPVKLGERLVYDDREQAADPPRNLVLKLVSIKRNELSFVVENGPPGASPRWQQDLAGNALPDREAGQLRWQGLLRRDLVLGQELSGELVSAADPERIAQVQGRVMSMGEQDVAGRRFDTVVIELGGTARDERGSTLLRGVMVVDRASGLLLRLEIECSNADFARWRRLRRIEATSG
jgi:hypothetical protein